MDFQTCPQCQRMVGVRGGKIDIHYIEGGIVPPLIDTFESEFSTILRKSKGSSKKRCALSEKPFLQSSLSTHEKDILGPNTLN